MVSSSQRGTEENGDKKNTLSKSSVFQQRTVALKPLCKHTFYLDVKSRTIVSRIEGKIRALGGNIELFLDKDVTHIITDKEIPTSNKEDVRSPFTSTQFGESKSFDSQKGGNGGERTPNHVTRRLKTRVSAMLEKARGIPSYIEKDIFAEAGRLSITVWTIEKALTWLNKVSLSLKPSSRHGNSNNRYNFRCKYYIKFEAFDRTTRPVFRELVSWPHVNVCGGAAAGDGGLVTTVVAPATPLEAPKPVPHRNMTRGVGRYGPTAAAATNSNVINVLHPLSANATLKPTFISFPGVTLTAGNVFTPGIISKEQDIQSADTKTTPHPAILNLNVRLNRRLSSLNKSSNRKTGTKVQDIPTLKLGRSTTKKANNVKDNIPGYCELCRLNFVHQSEHFVSEGHLKFVGDSKNYTEIDELIGKTAVEEFFKANNYQSVTSQELYTANNSIETAAMTTTRGSHRVSATDIAPSAGATARYGGGTSTRPRRHTTFNNSYLEISVDDDMMKPPECAREMRETRSTRHSQTKPADPESDTYWTSGRPKRACIQRKHSSSDDKLIPNNQAYYRVEVLSNKLRSTTTETTNTNSNSIHNKHCNEANSTCVNTVERKANSREQNGDEVEILTTQRENEDKGLIVKFRRLRNSELKQLNNEAVNFLFPRKDDSSSDEDIDDNCPNTTATSSKAAEISVVISSEDDEAVEEINETDTKEQIRTNKKKEETDTDENHSVDSNWSDCNMKKNQNHKRRRTHAEAFINDNQKYYKFETPGSRLRYQGTFMSTHDVNIEKQIRPRLNGENPIDIDDSIVYSEDKPQPKKPKLDDVKYSYELLPASEPWYQTFVRQDQGLEDYSYHKSFSDLGYYKPFYLPHQLPPLQPLDPRVCFAAYDRLKRLILEEAGIISLDPTPCSSTGNSTPTNNTQQIPHANASEATAHQQQQLNGREDHNDDIKRLDVNSHAGSTLDSEGGSGSNGASPFGDADSDLIAGDLEGGCSNSNNSHKEGRKSLAGGEDAGCCRKKERERDVETTNSTKIDLEQRRQQRRRQKRLLKAGTSSGRSPGRNARKSPRQHASTLAILSLLHQRKRREMNRSKSDLEKSIANDSNNLNPTREEILTSPSQSLVLTTQHSMTAPSTSIEAQSAEANELAMLLSTIDCMDAAIAAETIDIDKFHVDIVLSDAETLLQSYSKTDALAILEDYDNHKEVLSKTGLIHGAIKRSSSPVKKPGRKRKKKRKNMTGWPNVVKKTSANNIKKDMDGSTIDSLSITADSEDLDDTNDVSLAILAADSTDSVHLKVDVEEEGDMKMSLSNLSDLQSRRSPAPKSPTNRNNRVNSRSSANSEKLCEKTRNKHFSKQLKDSKNLNESVSNYSSANHCIYNNISDNNIGTNNTSNNRVNVNEEMFSENDIEDSLTYCNNTNSRETRIIDLSHHWRDRDKATRTAEKNSNSETHAAQFQPVVRVEKMNNRQLRSSVVSPSTKGSAFARGNSVSKSPTRSVSITRSSTSGSPTRSLSNSRGGSKQRASARRMPASPRSPRVLRKPRGRWYRDR